MEDTETVQAIYGNTNVLLPKGGNPVFLGLPLAIHEKDGA